jgi:hypothetical protein
MKIPSLAALAVALLLAPAAHADEREALERLRATTIALIEALVQQGLITRERADALLRPAQGAAAPSASPQWGAPRRPADGEAPPGTVRVPYLSETARQKLREELKSDIVGAARDEGWLGGASFPSWIRDLRLGGDLRLRAQAELYDKPRYLRDAQTGAVIGGPCDIVGGNLPAECFREQAVRGASPAWAPDLANNSIDRERLTLRARLRAEAAVTADTTAGLRLSTGSTSGPSSSSQTLGSQFNRSQFLLDRAWLRWEPRYDLTIVAGRMDKPFLAGDVVWPDDLGFDGLAATGRLPLFDRVMGWATAGAFPLEELSLSPRDKWLYALQIGSQWQIDNEGTQLRIGLAAYDFQRVEGIRETALPPADPRAGTMAYFASQYPASVRLKGNTLINLNAPSSTAAPTWGLASKFKPLHLAAQFDMRFGPRPEDAPPPPRGVDYVPPPPPPLELQIGLDWLRNTAFDLADIQRRAGIPISGLKAKTSGGQVHFRLGKPGLTERGHWLLQAAWRRLERDAWIDGFTDTTWHLGGTNYEGWQLGGQYAFDRRTSLGLRVTSTRNLDDGVRTQIGNPPVSVGNLSSAPMKIDVIQIDLSTRF